MPPPQHVANIVSKPCSYGHLLVITGYFYGIIHSIMVFLSTYNWYNSGLNCGDEICFQF